MQDIKKLFSLIFKIYLSYYASYLLAPFRLLVLASLEATQCCSALRRDLQCQTFKTSCSYPKTFVKAGCLPKAKQKSSLSDHRNSGMNSSIPRSYDELSLCELPFAQLTAASSHMLVSLCSIHRLHHPAHPEKNIPARALLWVVFQKSAQTACKPDKR